MTVQMNRKRWLLLTIAACAALFLAVEAYRAISFYEDLSTGRDALLSLKADLDLDNLEDSEAQLLTKRRLLQDAQRRLSSAQTFVATDPLLALAARLPLVGKQTDALSKLVVAANEATHTGLVASDVALAFARYEPDPSKTSIEEALTFLLSQEDAMADVQGRLAKLERLSADIPGGLLGPLESGRLELDAALEKLASLVDGYDRAHALLPELFGLYGPRRYLILAPKRHRALPIRRPDLQLRHRRPRPGPARVDGARVLRHLVRPLAAAERRRIRGAAALPLQNYLKRDFSWGLGEAGWYPDFPTTAQLSRSFVTKGGAPPTDGTIAIDLKFIGALLELLGPVSVPAYDVTVTAANVNELTLALTRNENYVPGEPRKAFLSHLAHALLGRILAVPQERWVDLLRLLDRMGQERHLQLHFRDADLQAASRQYGLDGGLIEADGDDFLLVADTSVNSTKLNLIMRPRVILDVQLLADGGARSTVTYRLTNPLPEWQSGRDPVLVKQLMLEGVYGCYLRVYAPRAARFQEVPARWPERRRRAGGRGAGQERVRALRRCTTRRDRHLPVLLRDARRRRHQRRRPDTLPPLPPERGRDGRDAARRSLLPARWFPPAQRRHRRPAPGRHARVHRPADGPPDRDRLHHAARRLASPPTSARSGSSRRGRPDPVRTSASGQRRYRVAAAVGA